MDLGEEDNYLFYIVILSMLKKKKLLRIVLVITFIISVVILFVYKFVFLEDEVEESLELYNAEKLYNQEEISYDIDDWVIYYDGNRLGEMKEQSDWGWEYVPDDDDGSSWGR